ncbi:hypothetical protein L9F63_021003 [Diploptera punctata]|uniref:La-related protein 7 n=1 Tax=Diploptera punctata TaxID=6984 RepID=A0AAD8ECD2_DIPPU|nr:hypothetical protein L9F63_021003 [Diploptera punctata]
MRVSWSEDLLRMSAVDVEDVVLVGGAGEQLRDESLSLLKRRWHGLESLVLEYRPKSIKHRIHFITITEVGDSLATEEMDEENPSVVEDEQLERNAELSNKKVRRRKKQFYQNIRKQMEFYFSDANLTKDRFLGKLIIEDPNIDISIFLRFNKIRALTADARDIANALKSSELLSVTEDGTKVFRTTPVTQKENTDDCTIYVEQLPPDAQHDWLKEVFSAYGNVAYISIPKYKSSGKIKGFAFVEFETPEEANKTLEAFGAMGCRLSPQMAPDVLCSIKTFESEESKSDVPQEEIKTELTDEDPENVSEKKKKTVKLQLLEKTNGEENEVGKTEDDSESNQATKVKKRKKSDENQTEDNNAEQESIVEDSSSKKKKSKKNGSTELVGKQEKNEEQDTTNIPVDSVPKKKKSRRSDSNELVDKEEENEQDITNIHVDSVQKKKKSKRNDSTELVDKGEETDKQDSSDVHQSEKKKRKRKIEDADDKSNEEESDNVEMQIAKKKRKKIQEKVEDVKENKEVVSDDADKHCEKKKRKRKSEEIEDVEEPVKEEEEQTEGVEKEEEEEEELEEMDGTEDTGKRRRKRKKHKKNKKKPDVEASRLKVLSKKEWKRLRNKYLDLQKVKMKCLKQYLARNKWGKNTPARSQHSNGSMHDREDANTETVKVLETDSKPRISFTPGVIVHASLEEPVMDIKKFKADVKTLSEVEYVDVVMGGNEAFIRCATSTAAENFISNAPWQQTELLNGDDEKEYWDRIFQDRHEKSVRKYDPSREGVTKC